MLCTAELIAPSNKVFSTFSQEHLILVTELLRANLYEFQRYIRDAGEPVYFTLPACRASPARCKRATATSSGDHGSRGIYSAIAGLPSSRRHHVLHGKAVRKGRLMLVPNAFTIWPALCRPPSLSLSLVIGSASPGVPAFPGPHPLRPEAGKRADQELQPVRAAAPIILMSVALCTTPPQLARQLDRTSLGLS